MVALGAAEDMLHRPPVATEAHKPRRIPIPGTGVNSVGCSVEGLSGPCKKPRRSPQASGDGPSRAGAGRAEPLILSSGTAEVPRFHFSTHFVNKGKKRKRS